MCVSRRMGIPGIYYYESMKYHKMLSPYLPPPTLQTNKSWSSKRRLKRSHRSKPFSLPFWLPVRLPTNLPIYLPLYPPINLSRMKSWSRLRWIQWGRSSCLGRRSSSKWDSNSSGPRGLRSTTQRETWVLVYYETNSRETCVIIVLWAPLEEKRGVCHCLIIVLLQDRRELAGGLTHYYINIEPSEVLALQERKTRALVSLILSIQLWVPLRETHTWWHLIAMQS